MYVFHTKHFIPTNYELAILQHFLCSDNFLLEYANLSVIHIFENTT